MQHITLPIDKDVVLTIDDVIEEQKKVSNEEANQVPVQSDIVSSISEEEIQVVSVNPSAHHEHHDPRGPKVFATIVSVSTGAKEVGNLVLGLTQSGNKSLPTLIVSSGAAFASTMGLTYGEVKHNVNEFSSLVRTGTPDHWPKLSRKKEVAAFSLALLISAGGAFNEFTQTAFLLSDMLKELKIVSETPLAWKIASYSIAVGASGTMLATEGGDTLKLIRQALHNKPHGEHEHSHYHSNISKHLSRTYGCLFIAKSLQDGVQNYMAMKTIFKAEDMTGKSIFMALSGANMVTNICFIGMFNMRAFDAFYGYMANIRSQSSMSERLKRSAAMTISGIISGGIAYLKMGLNEEFFKDVIENDIGINNHRYVDPAIDATTKAVFVLDTLQGTAALYPLTYVLVKQTANKTYNLGSFCYSTVVNGWNKAKGWLFPEKASAEEKEPLLTEENRENFATPDLIVTVTTVESHDTQNRHRLFTPSTQTFNHFPKTNSLEQQISNDLEDIEKELEQIEKNDRQPKFCAII
ncbi:hypothetical protein [Aquicella lusitana]|uniref:Uncharacterized protein n=1 Tax=Aquicella lusitana TaxID=254246 RepID=A0A370GQS0_9COXI|nr:hypothetical protein [Aquicella lusitana]RDI44834.1 hypothetical protein C8D86_10888 [Aquicella lusitana]VVC73031.1 hypothetical protein AQULUS_07590 [Aquicella lusitana]